MTPGCDIAMTVLDQAGAAVGSVAQRRRGAALESAILDAAYAELSEVGYTGFSVEAVAARARTGKASIYRRWPTKGELVLDAVCERMPEPGECGFELEFPDDVTTLDALHEVAHLIAEVLNSPDGSVLRIVKCEAGADPELARAIDERFQAPRRAALVRLLQRGVARGEVRPGAATPIVADVLPAVLFHRVVMLGETLTEAAIRKIMEQVLMPIVETR